ncbi:hypothetical protein PRNP1_010155 [Phytophthora ramorum]
MAQLFAADDKFADVVSELEARGWRRLPFVGCPKFDLKWTNYSKVAWGRVTPQQLVNHLQHSILFSQKDKFTELLYDYAHCQDQGQLRVDQCFPRTFDLSKARDQLLLQRWVLYSEAVAVLKRRLNGSLAVDGEQLEAAMKVVRETLDDEGFFENWRRLDKELGDVDKYEEPLSLRVLDCSKRAVEELLSESEQRDPQFHAVAGENGGNVWICKPSNLSQGRGIVLCNSLKALTEITAPVDGQEGGDTLRNLSALPTKWIVQKYIERPLLLQNGRKFDIRQWVLITKLEPKPVAFWFDKSYLRFCSRKFELTRLQDRFTHLSNYSVQQYFTPEKVPNEGRTGPDVGAAMPVSADPDAFEPMWMSDQFREALRQKHGRDVWTEMILPQMQSTARLALVTVLSKLKVVGRGFEWLGFDFLVDENHRVWLLEVNVSPDVSHSTRVTAELAPKATTDALNLVLDASRSPDNGWLPFALE